MKLPQIRQGMTMPGRRLALGLLMFWVPCFAFSAVLEEVVVTAQKREQSLEDVGISMSAFTGKQMDAMGISSTENIGQQVPGLMVTDFGGGTTTVFTMRGAGQLDFNDQQEGPVAVYLDGAYVSFLGGVGFNFYDINRVEVLRGSQGTLFGRNATAGVVQIITNKPTRKPEGYIELTGGEYGMIKGEAAISGPITDSLSGRLSLFHDSDNGYIKNTLGHNSHDANNNSGRAQLLYEPNDRLSVLVSGRWSIDNATSDIYDIRPAVTDVGGIPGLNGNGLVKFVTPAQYYYYCKNIMPNVLGVPTRPVYGASDCFGDFNNDGPFKASANLNGYLRRNIYGLTTTINYQTEIGTLTSITDWQNFRKLYLEDSDSTPQTLFHFPQNMDANQESEELRLANDTTWGRWLVGAYFLNINSRGRTGLEATGSLGIGLDNYWALDTTTYAGFSQVEYNFTPTLTGIVGIRWTQDIKHFNLDVGCTFQPGLVGLNAGDCAVAFAGTGFIQATGLPRTKRTEGNWSGNVELDWHPNPNWLVYGKVVRGHKAGGFNGGIVSFFTIDQVTYGPELPVTYEGGFKAGFFGGKARLNTAVFYTDYKGFQTFTQAGPSLLVFNIDSRMLGSEIELATNPWKGWEFLFGLSLLDAKQLHLAGPDGVHNRPMPNAPDVTFNGLARYEWPAFGGTMAAQMDMNYVAGRSLAAINSPALHGDAYVVANASVQWTSPGQHWQYRLWVKNFNNEIYFPTTFDITTITGVTQPVVADPRWFGGTVSYHW